MVGSKAWFIYTTDAGTNYAIQLDKSNALAVNPSASSNSGLPTAALPRNIKPRYALFSSTDGNTRRKVPLLKDTDVAALTPTSKFTPQGTTVEVTVSYTHGEIVQLPKVTDTGLTT